MRSALREPACSAQGMYVPINRLRSVDFNRHEAPSTDSAGIGIPVCRQQKHV